MYFAEFVTCGEIQPPEFGRITERSLVHAAFECNDGYQLIGDDLRMCIEGSWSGDLPICQGKKGSFENIV